MCENLPRATVRDSAAEHQKSKRFLPLRHMKGPEVHVPPDTETRRSVRPNKSRYSRPLRAPSAATIALVPPPLRQTAVCRFAFHRDKMKHQAVTIPGPACLGGNSFFSSLIGTMSAKTSGNFL